MLSFSKAAAASLTILAASTILGARAYVPADVCSMDVTLQYWDSGVTSGTPIVFPISTGNGESMNIDGTTTAELQLQPGDVTIQVQGKLCSSHADFINDGVTVAWDTGAPRKLVTFDTHCPVLVLYQSSYLSDTHFPWC